MRGKSEGWESRRAKTPRSTRLIGERRKDAEAIVASCAYGRVRSRVCVHIYARVSYTCVCVCVCVRARACIYAICIYIYIYIYIYIAYIYICARVYLLRI